MIYKWKNNKILIIVKFKLFLTTMINFKTLLRQRQTSIILMQINNKCNHNYKKSIKHG